MSLQVAVLLSIGLSAISASAITVGETVAKLDEIHNMREGLASSLSGRTAPITEETFQQVCAPAGKALKIWAEKVGVKAKQVSSKFRNPNHAPSSEEALLLKEFEKDPQRTFIVRAGTAADPGASSFQVYRRIRVTKDCLHCHGERDTRPDYIKAKYPKDLAFGFKPGDLRGMFSVSAP